MPGYGSCGSHFDLFYSPEYSCRHAHTFVAMSRTPSLFRNGYIKTPSPHIQIQLSIGGILCYPGKNKSPSLKTQRSRCQPPVAKQPKSLRAVWEGLIIQVVIMLWLISAHLQGNGRLVIADRYRILCNKHFILDFMVSFHFCCTWWVLFCYKMHILYL